MSVKASTFIYLWCVIVNSGRDIDNMFNCAFFFLFTDFDCDIRLQSVRGIKQYQSIREHFILRVHMEHLILLEPSNESDALPRSNSTGYVFRS